MRTRAPPIRSLPKARTAKGSRRESVSLLRPQVEAAVDARHRAETERITKLQAHRPTDYCRGKGVGARAFCASHPPWLVASARRPPL